MTKAMTPQPPAAPALSGKQLAQVTKTGSSINLPLPAGSVTQVSFDGYTILRGDEYWGTAGTALPLNVTVNADGNIVLPDADAIYDCLLTVLGVAVDGADAGKTISVKITGNDCQLRSYAPVGGSSPFIDVEFTDRLYKGDIHPGFTVEVDTTSLSQDALLGLPPRMLIVKR